jgi:signal transduction histidine kinase/CheY-like chemotaxis protein
MDNMLAEDSEDLNARVTAEQVRMVFLHSPTTTAGSLACGVFLVGSMWTAVMPGSLLLWFAVLVAHQALRIRHYREYVKASPGVADTERWARLYMMAIYIAGFIWGGAGVLMFVPGSIAHQAFICLILFGITGVSIGSLSAYWPAIRALIPMTLGPFCLRAMLEFDLEHALLAVPALLTIAGALSFSRRVNRLVAESIRKRFENEALVDALSRQTAIAEAARAAAEAANRSKSQFFAAASHDLRQPLHAMGLFASALQGKAREPEVAHLVGSINASVGALEGLFNELLDISKIDAGVIRPAVTTFAVDTVLDRLRMEFSPEAQEKGLRLVVRRSGALVDGDPLLFERILRNLISNALRYTHKGGVLVGCRRRGATLVVEVHDTGIGIAPDQRESIFEEFYQVGNPERSSRKGLGLGLSIVRRLSTLTGSTISLDSRPGHGSTFRCGVPLAPPSAGLPVGQPSSTAPAADFHDRVIVVIDDDDAIVDGMRALLEGWGARVIASHDGSDVMAKVQSGGRLPELIIADYRLEGDLVGTDLIARLQREIDPEIPAILVTGSTTPDRVEEAERQGHRLLLKPVNPARLKELISLTLDRSATRTT